MAEWLLSDFSRQFWPRNIIKEVEVKRRSELAPHPGYQPLWVIVKLAPGYTFEVREAPEK